MQTVLVRLMDQATTLIRPVKVCDKLTQDKPKIGQYLAQKMLCKKIKWLEKSTPLPVVTNISDDQVIIDQNSDK